MRSKSSPSGNHPTFPAPNPQQVALRKGKATNPKPRRFGKRSAVKTTPIAPRDWLRGLLPSDDYWQPEAETIAKTATGSPLRAHQCIRADDDPRGRTRYSKPTRASKGR